MQSSTAPIDTFTDFSVAFPINSGEVANAGKPLTYQAKIKLDISNRSKQLGVQIENKKMIFFDVEETDSLGVVNEKWQAFCAKTSRSFHQISYPAAWVEDDPSSFAPGARSIGNLSKLLKDTKTILVDNQTHFAAAIGWVFTSASAVNIGESNIDPNAGNQSHTCYTFESDGSITSRKIQGDLSTAAKLANARIEDAVEAMNLGYGPPATDGDVISTFLDFEKGELSFSINEQHLGVACKIHCMTGSWRPIVLANQCQLQLNLAGPSWLAKSSSNSATSSESSDTLSTASTKITSEFSPEPLESFSKEANISVTKIIDKINRLSYKLMVIHHNLIVTNNFNFFCRLTLPLLKIQTSLPLNPPSNTATKRLFQQTRD